MDTKKEVQVGEVWYVAVEAEWGLHDTTFFQTKLDAERWAREQYKGRYSNYPCELVYCKPIYSIT